MSDREYSFGPFRLDPDDRRLTREGRPVELNARYLDALLLMLGTPGRLVSKERFHEEVWRGIPVTDEALTQCVRTLRRALEDDASAPVYIETVPRHGYRFIAPVEAGDTLAPASSRPLAPSLLDAVAAALGGGSAGICGGLVYATAGMVAPGIGAASTLLVLVSISLLLGFVGGAGVGLGIALAAHRAGTASGWTVAGAALGGLLTGALGQMIGNDVFDLLFGHAPESMTGAPEGLLLGAAVGIGVWSAHRAAGASVLRRLAPGFATGGLAGLTIALLGGRLMAGSMAQLVLSFPDSRLRLDRFGALLGEDGFGPLSLALATVFEGALFAGLVSTALVTTRRLAATPASDQELLTSHS